MKEELELQLTDLRSSLSETKQAIKSIDDAIASCERGIQTIIRSFYTSGFWARPRRSKCIKRIVK